MMESWEGAAKKLMMVAWKTANVLMAPAKEIVYIEHIAASSLDNTFSYSPGFSQTKIVVKKAR
jgi:hypothetical protein